ncbi:MAG: response regulator [Thermoplasmata archaeon]|nr:response regulator [Thermoplasmata archaeon]
MRLLVVDDDPVFRDELAELLRDDGHEVGVAGSVAAGVAALEAGEVDVVFTDLKMPRHGGLELLAEVRRRWPSTMTVVITGFATVETAVEAMKLGAFDYLRKPFRIEQIHRILELARDEAKFQGGGAAPATVDQTVRRWIDRDGLAVLHLTDRPVRSRPGLDVVRVGPGGAAVANDAVAAFLGGKEKVGVVVEGVDRLFESARASDLVAFVGALRVRLEGRGPVLVTYDPARTPESTAQDLRAALVGLRTRAILEALSNPIRRAVLRRSGAGRITFGQALEAAGLDDSPKLSFHMHRLVEEGLLAHVGDEYRITPEGEQSLRLLAAWDAVASSGTAANAAIAQRAD